MQRGRPWTWWLAWSLCGLKLLLLPPTLWLIWLNRQAPDVWWYADPASSAGAMAAAIVGALVAASRPRNPIGWLLLGTAVLGQVAVLATQWGVYGLVTAPGAPAAAESLWLGFLAVVLVSPPLVPLLTLLFPSGRLTDRPAVVAFTLIGVAFGVLLVGSATTETMPRGFGDLYSTTSNPWQLLPTLGPIENPAFGIFAMTACTLLAVGLLLRRFWLSGGLERQQYKLVVVALVFTVSTVIADVLARVFGTGFHIVTSPLQSLAIGLLPVSIGVAILRYRLWDIDVLINRALVYTALTACVVGIYVLSIGWLGNVFQTRGTGNVALSLIATGVVAVLFQPLRERIQRAVNRLLYGERDDPYTVISRLSQRLEDMPAPDEVLPAIAAAVRDALKLPYSAIALQQGGVLVPTATAGTPIPDDSLIRIPLVYQHETLGELHLAPRTPGELFSTADRRLLDDLARQAGVAIYAVRLTYDLQQARERLVSTREEERRRLRRDLHDGLGSQLAALHLQAGVLRPLIDTDPAAAQAEVVELRSQLRAAIASIRNLVHGLRPPAIDELGLLLAVRERVRQYDSALLLVTTDFPDSLPPLTAATEVAVYRIVEEALANVVNHAAARTGVVRLAVGETLMLTIADDGVGIAATARSGVGLLSMRERAAELGGHCRIEPRAGGGTQIVVDLPLPKDYAR